MIGNILVFNNRPFPFTLFSPDAGALNSDENTSDVIDDPRCV